MLIALAVVGGLILLLLIVASIKPNDFRVERTARINAPPERIFPHINDFHQWVYWSPYESLDPDMRKTISGAPAGKGSIYEWEGNSKAGKGRMEILDSAPNHIGIQLQFERPFKARNLAEFNLTPNGSATDVTWATYGPQPFMSKFMSVFMSMDNLIGRDFERGLQNLKSVAEHS
jgi:uncharacterized protein YndB with AHSA1/START domain